MFQHIVGAQLFFTNQSNVMSLKDDMYPNIVAYVTPFSPIDVYRRLGQTCCLHITLKREAAGASEMRTCALSG